MYYDILFMLSILQSKEYNLILSFMCYQFAQMVHFYVVTLFTKTLKDV